MIDDVWKKKRRESFVAYLARENDLFETSVEELAFVSVLVDYLIEDLCLKFSGQELENILNDDLKLLDRYIAFLETRLELGNFRPSN